MTSDLGCRVAPPASLPSYLALTVSETVPIPMGRHRGVTVVQNHGSVLVSVHKVGQWRGSSEDGTNPVVDS